MTIQSPFEYIPSEWHLASLFLVGILGFLMIIGFPSARKEQASKMSIVKSEPQEDELVGTKPTKSTQKSLPPRTPGRTTKGPGRPKTPKSMTPKKNDQSTPSTPPIKDSYGSVSTPGGRRSARVARKRQSASPRE
mmetsp:Transcript_18569/g.22744  ORF Transcript_18569/g.22744 Transcript_18569/m.22744 type:complete len:135 (-) Transcript_18569:107-511(-)